MKSLLVMLGCAILLVACGGGGSNDQSTAGYSLSGRVQKGPLAIGSQITVNELDDNLNPTGAVYNVQTSDDLGNFLVAFPIKKRLVEIVGDGFYMNELTGNFASSRIQLRAIADLSVNNTPTVNVLTSLQAQRIRSLLSQGLTYQEANIQSQNEVITALGIDPVKVLGLSNFYSMRIDGDTDADAVLLAVSSIFSKMAENAATANSTTQSAELSNYINTIASQIGNTGRITNSSYSAAIKLAATQIDLLAIRRNVESYYLNRGITLTAPRFEEWVDKDSSGVLPRRLKPVTGLSFTNVSDGSPLLYEVITSNTLTVSGLGVGIDVPVSASEGATIIKNGTPISSLFSTLRDGDTIALSKISTGFGKDLSTTLHIGLTVLTWQVKTKPRIVTFFQGSPDSCPGSSGLPNAITTDLKYYAVPFKTDQVDFLSNATVISKFVALGIFYDGGSQLTPSSLEIRNDFNGAPSGDIVASVPATSHGYGLDPTYDIGLDPVDPIFLPLFDRFGNRYSPNKIYMQGYFGPNGLTLDQNKVYWLIAVYPALAQPQVALCGLSEPTPFGQGKISTDGINWSNAGTKFLPNVILFE